MMNQTSTSSPVQEEPQPVTEVSERMNEKATVSLKSYFGDLQQDVVNEYMKAGDGTELYELYEPSKGELIEFQPLNADIKADEGILETDSTVLSFGDGGTKSTVTEWGQQVQTSRFLGHGASGIYSIDCPEVPEPGCLKDRNKYLLDKVQYSGGFGPDTTLPAGDWTKKIFWVRNRWPRIVFERPGGWTMVVQWMVQDNVVIQQLVCTNLSEDTIEINYSCLLDMVIRELDFSASSPSFNSQENKNHDQGPGPGGYGFVKLYGLSDRKEKENSPTEDGGGSNEESTSSQRTPDAVAAVLGIFINGKPLKSDKLEIENPISIKPTASFHLIAGYKLVLLSKQSNDWEQLLLTRADLDIDGFLKKDSPGKDVSLDAYSFGQPFYVGRNVEHILSVCAMPITPGLIWDDHSNASGMSALIALTCGEMASHRVCSSASYFAFRFLLEVARDLPIAHPLANRIRETCFGHLRWVFQLAKQKDNGIFHKYYWVTGDPVPSTSWLRSDGPTDSPFQILKAYDLFDFLKFSIHRVNGLEQVQPSEEGQPPTVPGSLSEGISAGQPSSITPELSTDPLDLAQQRPVKISSTQLEQEQRTLAQQNGDILGFINGRVRDIAMSWVDALNGANRRNAFAWVHANRGGMDYFRLDDHVWIWSTLKAISVMLNWETNVRSDRKKRKKEQPSSTVDLMRKYTPSKVKKDIILRFTTLYDVVNEPKERMLAVTRSPRETRFELHSRDTALFYHLGGELMLEGDKEDRWSKLVQIQKRFLASQDFDFENPLRHGLLILMTGSLGETGQKDLEEPKSTINKSMLTSGLFPGQLSSDEGTESSVYHQDHLLHVPFEVPFLLYITTKRLPKKEKEISSGGNVTNEDVMTDAPPLNGRIPFNDQIDAKSITDVKEEWLYNYPPFFDSVNQSEVNIALKRLTLAAQLFQMMHKFNLKYGDGDEGDETVARNKSWNDPIARASDAWLERNKSEPNADNETKSYSPVKALPVDHKHLMIDIGKKQSGGKRAATSDRQGGRFKDLDASWERLREARTVASAKKRVLWCRNPPVDYALMCYLPSTSDERPGLQLFFDRHAIGSTLFEDRTARVLNTWKTEFHCTFLRLVGPPNRNTVSEEDRNGTGNTDGIPGGNLMFDPVTRSLPLLDKRSLKPSCMSFRFHGDFFDRFWTCHHISSFQGNAPQLDMDEYLQKNSQELERIFEGASKDSWSQRKVLEQLLFHLIIVEVNISTTSIIQRIQKSLDSVESKDTVREIFGPDSRAHFDRLEKWADLHAILEALDDDLERIYSNMKSWNSREQDRHTEKPRWTNNDEKKYRDAINQISLECQKDERGLLANKASVLSLTKNLEYRREQAKNAFDSLSNQISLRQNVNIMYFTYSTVVFLPLGFAASVYSMQAAPPTDVLQHMVICAVVAFVIMLLVIFMLPLCLKLLATMSTTICKAYEDFKALYRFWRRFHTCVPFSFADLFTLHLPSFVIFLKSQLANRQSVRRDKQVKSTDSKPLPPLSLDPQTSNSLKIDTRNALKDIGWHGQEWALCWNKIVGPWNKITRDESDHK